MIKTLIIEDDQFWFKIHCLSIDGSFDVKRVETLTDILGQIDKFDLILADLSLPDSEPFNTLQTLIKTFPDTPIIIVTAYDDQELIRASIGTSVQGFIPKSEFSIDAIRQTILKSIARFSAGEMNDTLDRMLTNLRQLEKYLAK